MIPLSEPNHDFALKDGGYSNYENTTNLPRHRWYFYKEGFSPALVEEAINHAKVRKEDLVIDPFNGSGSTTLTASLKGHKSLGIEVNPFTSFLSEAKVKNARPKDIDTWKPKLLESVEKEADSNLIGYSTFSETIELDKWLFNESVLKGFEGGWKFVEQMPFYDLKRLFKLALISAGMQNCNAKRDGKCLRYRDSWRQNAFDKTSFIKSLSSNIDLIKSDIISHPIKNSAIIINGDCRKVLNSSKSFEKFKLCITSPPYLNTFDYTDIYRPELFLGKFVNNAEELRKLRFRTVRSHIQAKWKLPKRSDFGDVYKGAIEHVNDNKDKLMDKSIPVMIQAYFEDMHKILTTLRIRADDDAEVWFVVSNSAYADREIPVDLIIADIGSQVGWSLREVGVLRTIQKRKTKHSPNITQLRESVVIFSANKKQKWKRTNILPKQPKLYE